MDSDRKYTGSTYEQDDAGKVRWRSCHDRRNSWATLAAQEIVSRHPRTPSKSNLQLPRRKPTRPTSPRTPSKQAASPRPNTMPAVSPRPVNTVTFFCSEGAAANSRPGTRGSPGDWGPERKLQRSPSNGASQSGSNLSTPTGASQPSGNRSANRSVTLPAAVDSSRPVSKGTPGVDAARASLARQLSGPSLGGGWQAARRQGHSKLNVSSSETSLEAVRSVRSSMAAPRASPLARSSSKTNGTGNTGSSALWSGGKTQQRPPSAPAFGENMEEIALTCKTAKKLHLPLAAARQAMALFREIGTVTGKEGDLDIMEWRMSKEQFVQVLCRMLDKRDAKDLPSELVDEAFFNADADRRGFLDFGTFAFWLHANSFSEAVNLDDEQKELRSLARKYDMHITYVEKYKKDFDKYDQDGSGAIEPEEFDDLVHKCAKVPRDFGGMPSTRVQHFWRDADTDGNGVVDFEEFLIFHSKYFSANGAGVDDFYRRIRRHCWNQD